LSSGKKEGKKKGSGAGVCHTQIEILRLVKRKRGGRGKKATWKGGGKREGEKREDNAEYRPLFSYRAYPLLY